MIESINIRGREISRRTDAGNYLHTTALLALHEGERVAAYLALTWPAARSAALIECVCRIHPGSCTSATRALVAMGAICKVGRGQYALVRRMEG